MCSGESLQRGIGIDDRQLLLGGSDFTAQVVQFLFGLARGTRGVLVGRSGCRSLTRGREHSLLNGQLRLLFRQSRRQRVIVRQLIDQPVQARQLGNGRPLVRRVVSKMLVAVDDHAELRSPIADMVIGEDAMSEEPEDAIERVANHGAAQMPNVHRLGDVGR